MIWGVSFLAVGLGGFILELGAPKTSYSVCSFFLVVLLLGLGLVC